MLSNSPLHVPESTSTMEQQFVNNHNLMVEKLRGCLKGFKDNCEQDNVQINDIGGKKPPDYTFHNQ